MKALPDHVVFLTSTNLSCNPRCMKEVRTLANLNVQIRVVGFRLNNWTDDIESSLQKELTNVKFEYLETTRRDFLPWLCSTAIERMSRMLALLFPSNLWLASMAYSKRSWLLLTWIKKYKGASDLVIAHNPPAFYAARRLAMRSNSRFGIDIEDFHPGEGRNKQRQQESAVLMKGTLTNAIYVSCASPLIEKAVVSLMQPKEVNTLVINNVFTQSEFTGKDQSTIDDRIVKIVWFSQHIDRGRGLEQILPALDKFADHIQLDLIGNLRKDFYEQFLKQRQYVHCLPPIPQQELNKKLGEYDIGLAIEDKHADMNRNICLTNKIWAYLQSGLYIIASDTDAQKMFLSSFRYHGSVTSLSTEDIFAALKNVIANITEIRMAKPKRVSQALSSSWDHEKEKFLDVVMS